MLHWIILFCFYWNWEAEKCISLPLFIRWKKEPDKLTSNYIKLAGFAYFSTLKKHMQCWNKKCFSKAFANWHKKIKRCSAFIWRLESGFAELYAPVWGGVMGDFHPSHREFCCNMSSNIMAPVYMFIVCTKQYIIYIFFDVANMMFYSLDYKKIPS